MTDPAALLGGQRGLPAYIVSALERRAGGLAGTTVGILGMAFKVGSDNPRASLSYKLLLWAGASVYEQAPRRHPAVLNMRSFHWMT